MSRMLPGGTVELICLLTTFYWTPPPPRLKLPNLYLKKKTLFWPTRYYLAICFIDQKVIPRSYQRNNLFIDYYYVGGHEDAGVDFYSGHKRDNLNRALHIFAFWKGWSCDSENDHHIFEKCENANPSFSHFSPPFHDQKTSPQYTVPGIYATAPTQNRAGCWRSGPTWARWIIRIRPSGAFIWRLRHEPRTKRVRPLPRFWLAPFWQWILVAGALGTNNMPCVRQIDLNDTVRMLI